MPRIILSASRRTDIPALYMPWFMARIQKGFFEVDNPYNRQIVRVPAKVDQVHTIVFWSKDFGPFLREKRGQALRKMGYPLFFNFTLNSPHPILEPALPPLEQRLTQLGALSDQFGPQTIQWRFDPICFFTSDAGTGRDNLDQFPLIAAHVARLGIRVCITSFVDLYRKVLQRFKKSNLSLVDPPIDRKIEIVTAMADTLADLGIRLHLCCENEVLAALPERAAVRSGACIPGTHLVKLYGPNLSLSKDSGQRKAAGCSCTISKDIGSYHLHPCRHNCLYCYANPKIDPQRPISPG